ncbi:MAG: Pimeloyl-ACP methyl ester carboxylesterase [Nocardioidaceae bacterium]|nr:Pimeloyl-ACP methyl ester carboxylesterase [Nocardioidaceae bacterium]
MISHCTTASGPVEIRYDEQGSGHPVLVLHGGAGPQSVAGFAALLAGSRPARVLTPTHPGFGGTPRPESLDSIRALAEAYAALLDALDLTDVTVVGNSIGGWVAAELALLGSPRVRSVLLVDAVGLDIPAHPVVDFFSLTMDQVAELSYFAPDRFRIDVAAMPPAQQAAMAGNRASLLAYGGTSMADPTLLGRLPGVDVPVLVVWGAADRIVTPEHGTAYAAAIPGARLTVIDGAGHLPQLETPDRLVELTWDFVDQHATGRPE